MCSREIFDVLPGIKVFGRASRSSSRAHQFHINEIVERTAHYRVNSFFARTLRMLNTLPENVFPADFDVQGFKVNVYRYLKSS